MYDLSIIIPTCNRAPLLAKSLAALRDGVQCSFEVIVVDGASDDDTPRAIEDAREYLGDRIKVIREPHREGFVKAANKGFRAASGRNMTWLNDDARPLSGALDRAVEQIDATGKNIAFLAIFHSFASTWNIAYKATRNGTEFVLSHVRGTLYANFAIGRRTTFSQLDYFDERFFLNGADPDLSLKAWSAGLRVEPAWGVFIEHDEHHDDRRAFDASRAQRDNEQLFAKWDLPPRNPQHNDFDPAGPCTLRGLREAA